MNEKEKEEKLKERFDRIRAEVEMKESRRQQTDNFADIFDLQNNDFSNAFNGKFNGGTNENTKIN